MSKKDQFNKTLIHRKGFAEEVTEILLEKKGGEPFSEYVKTIKDELDLDLTENQVRYFHVNYVLPNLAIRPAYVKRALGRKLKMVDVLVEQIRLYDIQLNRIIAMLEMEDIPNAKVVTEFSSELFACKGLLRDIKETKQELGLMYKEPEKFDIKTNHQVEVQAMDLATIKKIAAHLADRDE